MMRDNGECEVHDPQASRRITAPKMLGTCCPMSNVEHSRDPVSGLPTIVIDEYSVDTI